MPMGDKLKWLLKRGVGVFREPSLLKIGPPYLLFAPWSHLLPRQPFVRLHEQLFTVQKSEELRESGEALYSDTSCVVVSLASTSLAWSDQTASNSAASPHIHVHYACLLHIILVCWVGVLLNNKWPFAITFSENGGWAYFREAMVYIWE